MHFRLVFCGTDALLLFGLDAVVVLLAIDLTAGAVLFTIDLGVFLAGEFATVGLAIGVNLLIDSLLTIFGVGRFASGHLAAADTLGDAILLELAARTDFVVAVVGGVGVVLVVVDGAADVVLLAIDLIALLLGELAAIGRAIGVNLAIEIGFAAFEVFGFAGGELAGLDAVGDAILLIFAPVVDGVGGLCRLALLCEEWTRSNEGSDGEGHECLLHMFLLYPEGPCLAACGPRSAETLVAWESFGR